MCKSNLIKGALGVLGIGAVVGVVAYKIKEHRLNREIEFWEDFSEEEITEYYEYMDEMPEENPVAEQKSEKEEAVKEKTVEEKEVEAAAKEETTKPKKDKSK